MQGSLYRGFNRNIKIFYSYSETQRDEELQGDLKQHLTAIQDVTQWDHSSIEVGSRETRSEQISVI